MEDDEMIVVIVGDEKGIKSEDHRPVKIKEEVLEETPADELAVEELIETVEKHGKMLPDYEIKTEIEYDDPKFEDAEIEFIDNFEDEYITPDFASSAEDDEYLTVRKKKRKVLSTNILDRRRKMLEPSECKSFVADLKQTYPELASNKDMLVDSLAEIMRNVKAPKPPKDYFNMNGAMFECTVCRGLTETQPAAARHWQEKHGPRYLVCYACGVDFRSTTNLYKHEKRCRGKDAVIVLKARAQCLGMKARSRPYLQESVKCNTRVKLGYDRTGRKSGNDGTVYPCDRCAAQFHSKSALQAHFNLHTGERPHVCNHCPAAYTSRSALSRHLMKHNKSIRFICDHCKRGFKLKAALATHMDTHLPMRRWGCDLCERRFAQKMALQLHVDRVHRGLPPPHPCQICPRRFARMSLLKTHMLKEHGMNMVTRKMFFKLLPTLEKTSLEQAKVVFKSDEVYPEPVAILPDLPQKVKEEEPYNLDDPFHFTKDQIQIENLRDDSPNSKDKDNKVMEETIEDRNTVEITEVEKDSDEVPGEHVEIRIEDDTPTDEEQITTEVLQYLYQLREQGLDYTSAKVFVKNGQIFKIVYDDGKMELFPSADDEQDTNDDNEKVKVEQNVVNEEYRPIEQKKVKLVEVQSDVIIPNVDNGSKFSMRKQTIGSKRSR